MEKDPINNLDSESTPKPTPKKTRKRKVAVVGEDSLKSLIEPKVSSEDVVVCVPNSDIDKESVELSVENFLPAETKAETKFDFSKLKDNEVDLLHKQLSEEKLTRLINNL